MNTVYFDFTPINYIEQPTKKQNTKLYVCSECNKNKRIKKPKNKKHISKDNEQQSDDSK